MVELNLVSVLICLAVIFHHVPRGPGSRAVPGIGQCAAQKLRSEAVFRKIRQRLAEDPSLVQRVNAVYVMEILKDGKKAGIWTVDLKRGKVYDREPENGFDTKFTLEDGVMVDIANRVVSARAAFMEDKVKVKGSWWKCKRLRELLP